MSAHRPLPEIDAELAALEARLNVVRLEREQARKEEIAEICRLFDAGWSLREIARDVRQSKAAVQGVLFRSGRTEGGRIAIRHQISKAAATSLPQSPAAAPVAGVYVPATIIPSASHSVRYATHGEHVAAGHIGAPLERERLFPVAP